MAAVLQGRDELVAHLLRDRTVDTRLAEKDGYTPVHGAGFQGRAGIMRVLFEHGMDVNHVHEGDGYRPIHRACWGRHDRHFDTVRYLVEEANVPFDVPGGSQQKTCVEMTPNDRTRAWLLERSTASDHSDQQGQRRGVEL
jgi:ankyrin repeat protein